MAIIGLDRLRRKLTVTIPAHVEKATVAAMESGAAEMVALMRSLAPKKSGDLAASIGWTWGDAPKGAMALGRMRGRGSTGRKYITIYAGGGDAYYARFIEFGTQSHTIKAKNAPVLHLHGGIFVEEVQHPGSTAQPFFYPAYRALRRRVRGRITRQMKKAIKDGAK